VIIGHKYKWNFFCCEKLHFHHSGFFVGETSGRLFVLFQPEVTDGEVTKVIIIYRFLNLIFFELYVDLAVLGIIAYFYITRD
jgi:hypothetical protein